MVLLAGNLFLQMDVARIHGCCNGGCDNAVQLKVAAAFVVDANGRSGHPHVRDSRLLCVAKRVAVMRGRPLVEDERANSVPQALDRERGYGGNERFCG